MPLKLSSHTCEVWSVAPEAGRASGLSRSLARARLPHQLTSSSMSHMDNRQFESPSDDGYDRDLGQFWLRSIIFLVAITFIAVLISLFGPRKVIRDLLEALLPNAIYAPTPNSEWFAEVYIREE
ncbi:hypothetical protein QBC40DRAFT_300394 [Triangularia verruculosa]|uniref:Uncharacterized protein n=1 Tax=Triangularia verruculosa TaxID=2587418 RepID=A0AAN6X8W7_9PEZI|nr:hypothetical protein QBC40DRAFT_300394 [Triangularia verruculosa]